MKKTLFIFLLIVTNLSCSTAQKRKSSPQSKKPLIEYSRMGNVVFDSFTKGILSVTTEQRAETSEKAVIFCEINALENILFKGIPGSPQELPIIKEERKDPFLDKLIFDRLYEKFLTHSETLDSYKYLGLTSVKQKVSFDIEALRKELEKNNIIRKFGL